LQSVCIYIARYVRHQNVAWAHSDVKWVVLSGVGRSVACSNGTKMNYKGANVLV